MNVTSLRTVARISSISMRRGVMVAVWALSAFKAALNVKKFISVMEVEMEKKKGHIHNELRGLCSCVVAAARIWGTELAVALFSYLELAQRWAQEQRAQEPAWPK